MKYAVMGILVLASIPAGHIVRVEVAAWQELQDSCQNELTRDGRSFWLGTTKLVPINPISRWSEPWPDAPVQKQLTHLTYRRSP